MILFSKSSSSDKTKSRSKIKSRHKGKDKDNNKDKEKDKEKDRVKDRDRDRDRDRHLDRDKHKGTDHDRQDYDRDKHRDRHRDKGKDKDREKDRDRDKEKNSHSDHQHTSRRSISTASTASNTTNTTSTTSTTVNSDFSLPCRPARDSPTTPRPSPQKSSSFSHKSPSKSARSHLDPRYLDLTLTPARLDELRRLSAMAAMRDDARSSMDIDRESSTTPQIPVAAPTPIPAPSQNSPITNGVPNENEERSPTPPPHRSSPSQALSDDGGESFKLMGNRFYKLGDYNRAIEEYNKGQFILAGRDVWRVP